MGMAELARRVRQIKKEIRQTRTEIEDVRQMKNTTAKVGTVSDGKVYIDGMGYPIALASRDIILTDGCSVYCLPTASGYVVIGGGA